MKNYIDIVKHIFMTIITLQLIVVQLRVMFYHSDSRVL